MNLSPRLFSAFAGIILSAVLLVQPVRAADPERLSVFAAASLKNALDDVSAAWQKETGQSTAISYAASSTLAKQIEQDAPAQIFISADEDWMNYLAGKGLIKQETRSNLLGNELVLIAPKDSAVALDLKPGADLARALGGGRLAMGNVDSVPAGKYGKAALEKLGLWGAVSGKLAEAGSVRAALMFVSRGEAVLGIVYKTDALADPKVKTVATFPAAIAPSHRLSGCADPKSRPGRGGFPRLHEVGGSRALLQGARLYRAFGKMMRISEDITPHPILLSKPGLPDLQLKISAFASECGWGEGTPEQGTERDATSPLPSASASGCGHSQVASSPRRAGAGEGQGEGQGEGLRPKILDAIRGSAPHWIAGGRSALTNSRRSSSASWSQRSECGKPSLRPRRGHAAGPARVLGQVRAERPRASAAGLPPVVTGYLLLITFGRKALIGAFLDRYFGIVFSFRWTGAALACAVMGFPLMVRAIRLSIEGGRQAPRSRRGTLGASPLWVFLTITLPLSLPGIIAGMILSLPALWANSARPSLSSPTSPARRRRCPRRSTR